MLTPNEARSMSGSSAHQFEQRVDEALKRAARDDRWPCKIALVGHAHVAQEVGMKYRAAGWTVTIVPDQRDGDFMQLERP